MVAYLYYNGGTIKTIAIEKIDTITNNGDDGICVMLNDGGCLYPKMLDFSPHSQTKDMIDALRMEYEKGRADVIEKACEFLKSYRQDTPDGTGYIPGIINDETIEDFKQSMEE